MEKRTPSRLAAPVRGRTELGDRRSDGAPTPPQVLRLIFATLDRNVITRRAAVEPPRRIAKATIDSTQHGTVCMAIGIY